MKWQRNSSLLLLPLIVSQPTTALYQPLVPASSASHALVVRDSPKIVERKIITCSATKLVSFAGTISLAIGVCIEAYFIGAVTWPVFIAAWLVCGGLIAEIPDDIYECFGKKKPGAEVFEGLSEKEAHDFVLSL
ncbi:uncharacterized protein MYCFIDRAFT_202028 [Pseudocercospora fijiensis CIRAD86]|uniref:Uncharacterized protein n=1 Tax=Pseudocercospora fijiensis (strain CIRAD86) TaxID=383855 RepID=N1QA03_PSEFD|nr:uncharacterized protein MYCFIDRAFT_202028 [Pseudocercospora fijiensis CIRAD86]EME89684.1 hypothetical protein MYCFIDRAFT_202028 [Pseudocercospora fijiensis CIRAD86]